jgi:hypothetical protein
MLDELLDATGWGPLPELPPLQPASDINVLINIILTTALFECMVFLQCELTID